MNVKVRLVSLALISLFTHSLHSQVLSSSWNVSLEGGFSDSGNTPFWVAAGKRGLFPESDGAMLLAGADLSYKTKSHFDFTAGVSLAGTASGWGSTSSKYRVLPDELYAGVAWKQLHLDFGMKSKPYEYNGMSLTGGNITWSSNARNIPGINLYSDYIYFSKKKKVGFKFAYGNYTMLDNRFVRRPMLIETTLNMKFVLHPRVDLILEFQRWGQWGGISPIYGVQPHSFEDYIRALIGLGGGADASESDQVNVLGNQLGRELIRIDWRADAFTFSFAHDIPFDDGSGMGLQNFPDGVNTLMLSFNDRNAWVTDIIYEFVFTKWQSGKVHDRPVKGDEVPNLPNNHIVVGGCDNYFNNGEYKSGWTYYGRTIGLPLFTPAPRDENGIVYGVINNRVNAHNVGIGGVIAGTVPYKALFTYSRNFGTYGSPFKEYPTLQYSAALSTSYLIKSKFFPVKVGLGLYADWGGLLPQSFGLTLNLSYSGGVEKLY